MSLETKNNNESIAVASEIQLQGKQWHSITVFSAALCASATSAFQSLLFAVAFCIQAVEAQIVLNDATRDLGIDFHHRHGGCGLRYFIEQIGGGVVLCDFDGDGWIDICLLGGRSLGVCPRPTEEGATRFWRNVEGRRFSDVTGAVGLVATDYAIGGAVGDYDGDGDEDLYVTCYGPNRLYRNDSGRFIEVGGPAGVADPRLSTSAAFLDFDLDGDLDLYVANYVDYDPRNERPCEQHGVPAYCLPQDWPASPDRLYRNEGDGRFTDVTARAGVMAPRGRGFGVAVGDYDGDGAPDIFVANDATDNLLYHNQRDGSFKEVGLTAGVAVGDDGAMENGMGTDWGDFDGDGRLDLVVTNFEGQPNRLYRNLEGGFFLDVSYASGTGKDSFPLLGWASIFADFDLDGRLDLYIANGHVFDNVEAFREGREAKQLNSLFRNLGDGRFARVSADGSPGLGIRKNSRGAAAGDLDNDGDEDLVVNNWEDVADVLRNDTPRVGHWLGVRCAGKVTNRSAIGARVELTSGGKTQAQEVRSGGGYVSQNDLRIIFGLGASDVVESLVVRWPGGKRERFHVAAVDRYLTVVEGTGEVAAP